MRIRQFDLPGLGHLSTLIADDASGTAAVVDPRRDVDAYLAAATADGVLITHVIETHLHNDYVSGGRELAALTGATHVIGAGAGLAYDHRGVRHGDTVDLGGLRFKVLETPGHTPEHVSYAVADTSRAEEPLLLFTGGSLLVGAVGRTDLLGVDTAVPYARAMFRSLHEVILPHEDFVSVYPTHGAGSLCSTGIASTPHSTIGFERRYNPMIQSTEVDEFVRVLLRDQPAFPHYFARMRPLNQAGPALLGGGVPEARAVSVEEVRDALAGDALLIDSRQPFAHAEAHIPGSVSIPADSSFGTWLGWVVDADRPLILLLDDPADWDDLIRQALRIGYEQVIGYLVGGIEAWREAGLPLASGRRLTVDELAGRLAAEGPEAPLVIDVRQASEFATGHVPGSIHIRGGDLQSRLRDLPRDRPIATICASGFRSSIAASLLRRAGFSDVWSVADGVPAWQARGFPVDRVRDSEAAVSAATVPHSH
ncbi:MAG: rhodanese-like domain-containing protein [Chloroflexota bacterium]|nr:rhodanese-like domain-containing protein [Chloroflexota bacterium]